MSSPTPSRRLADHLIRGGLDAFVAKQRGDGHSWRTISVQLYNITKGQVDVTETTLRNWYPQNASTAA